MAKKHLQYRGIRGWVVAEVTEDTAQNFTTGEPFRVAGLAEVSKSTNGGESEFIYYDNEATLADGAQETDELTFNSAVIPDEALSKITGQYYDETKGLYVEGSREKKFYAVGYITKKTDGTEVFVWRLKGTFDIPTSTHATEDGTSAGNGQEVKYTGMETVHKFKVGDKEKTARSVSVDTSINKMPEDEFFSTVQTPETIVPSA